MLARWILNGIFLTLCARVSLWDVYQPISHISCFCMAVIMVMACVYSELIVWEDTNVVHFRAIWQNMARVLFNKRYECCIFPSRTHAVERSAHLTLSPKRYTVQFEFVALNRYSYEKIHTASYMARWADLSTRHHIRPRLKARAWCVDLRWAHIAFPTMPYAYNIALRWTPLAYRAYIFCKSRNWPPLLVMVTSF